MSLKSFWTLLSHSLFWYLCINRDHFVIYFHFSYITYSVSAVGYFPLSHHFQLLFCMLLKWSFSVLTILWLHFSSSLDFCLSVVCTMPYSSPLMSFLRCTWNTTASTPSPLGTIGFVYSIHFHFLACLRYEVVFAIVRSVWYHVQCC